MVVNHQASTHTPLQSTRRVDMDLENLHMRAHSSVFWIVLCMIT